MRIHTEYNLLANMFSFRNVWHRYWKLCSRNKDGTGRSQIYD